MTLLKIPWLVALLCLLPSPLCSHEPSAEKQLISAIEKIGGKVTFDDKAPGRIVAVNY
jgi:hypothetical protein